MYGSPVSNSNVISPSCPKRRDIDRAAHCGSLVGESVQYGIPLAAVQDRGSVAGPDPYAGFKITCHRLVKCHGNSIYVVF